MNHSLITNKSVLNKNSSNAKKGEDDLVKGEEVSVIEKDNEGKDLDKEVKSSTNSEEELDSKKGKE